MREQTIIAAVIFLTAVPGAGLALARYVLPWLRDRFRRLDIPDGWTADTLHEIRPGWDEPLTGELLIRDPHLGDLPVIDPVPPVLFHAVRDEHPVDLTWRPAWTQWAAA